MWASLQTLLVATLAKCGWEVLRRMLPVIGRQSRNVWRAAFPLATGIVADLADNAKLDGLEKRLRAQR